MINLSEKLGEMFQVVPPCGGHLGCISGALQRGGFKSCPRVGGILADVRKALGM